MHQTNIYETAAREMAVLKFSSPAKPGQFKAPAEISRAQVPAVAPFTIPAVQGNVIRPRGLMETLAALTAHVCCLPPPELRVCYLLASFPAGKVLQIAGFHEINIEDAGY